MISRPTHSRVIKPAAITGRDSTARYSAMRGAGWRSGYFQQPRQMLSMWSSAFSEAFGFVRLSSDRT
jgi:hypothetical protein